MLNGRRCIPNTSIYLQKGNEDRSLGCSFLLSFMEGKMDLKTDGFGNVTGIQEFEYILNKKRLNEKFRKMKENSFERWCGG